MPAVLTRGPRLLEADRFLTERLGLSETIQLSRLTIDTPVKSASEEACKKVILASGIPAYYEIHQFEVGDGIHSYKPDFALRLTMEGKPVIIEPHSFASKKRAVMQVAKTVSAIHEAYRAEIEAREAAEKLTPAQERYLESRAQSLADKTRMPWTNAEVYDLLTRMLEVGIIEWNPRGSIDNMHIAKQAISLLAPSVAENIPTAKESSLAGKELIRDASYAENGRAEAEVNGAIRHAIKGVHVKRQAYLEKIGAFRERHDVFTVLISGGPGKGTSRFVDLYWSIPIMNREPAERYQAGERRLAQLFHGLVMRSDQPELLAGNYVHELQELARAC